jgi:primosomal protein N' (replication factor Y)
VPRAAALLEALQTDGLVRRAEALTGPSVRVRRARFALLAGNVDVEATCAGPLARAPKQAALLRALAERGVIETTALDASGGVLRALVERGLATVEEREAPRNVLGAPVARETAPVLSNEQATALAPISAAIEARDERTFLLHGVTGSGKTEVYLRAIAKSLAAGRQALVLVPEITLTHQIVARLRARFGDRLAVLHSGLRPSERLEQWQRLRSGDTPIAVGARSALFAPIDDLGIIVIDEEHDSAYKNEEGFRYHARRLAARRAALAGCPLILGSATPALETRHRAERGEIERLVLERRIGGRPLPRVEIVDLQAEKRKAPRGRKLILTKPLRQALAQTLDEDGQAILFLNRRGFSTQIFCFGCGYAERCAACEVALVYHAAEHALRCHYCDFSKPPPEHCGGCGNPDTALLGTGTERLEEEVRKLFPGARLARLDRDTASRRGHVEEVLAGLREGAVDVLIGTQMVAKGHDFPGVRLVGVIAADLGLHMPDFRAAERCFQLLTQVAGRAGRSHEPGRVILQTFVPDHYAIRPVRSHDYEGFYREEIAHRAELGYPPFGALSQVIVSGEDAELTEKSAEALAAGARAKRGSGPGAEPGVCEVLGPTPAPLPRLRGRHRIQLVVKGRDRDRVHALSAHLADAARGLAKGIQVSVDVDPVNML